MINVRDVFARLLLLTIIPLTIDLRGSTTESIRSASEHRPNILLILTDDMGYGDISSFARNPLKVKTPNIDRLADEGMKFTQFYVSMPICSPSRASILSGLFAPETQLTSFLQWREGNYGSDQNDYMDPALSYLPKVFQSAGYKTGHIGKWHLGGGHDIDNAPSIKEFGYDECYSTWESPNRDPKLNGEFSQWDKRKIPGQVDRWDRSRYMVDKTLDFMERHKDKPCFMTLWPDDLHTPYWPSPEMLKKYGGKPDGFGEIENFYGVLEEYDRQIGRLLDALKKKGFDANTIVIFTGDNGPAPHYDQTRSDGMRGMKLSLYEGGIRQPFIVRWPGQIPAASENTETVLSAMDLLPTLTALAGLELPEAVRAVCDGEDLSAAMLGKTVRRTKPILWEFGRTERVPRPASKSNLSPPLAIRQGDFKLLVDYGNTVHELYNIVKDPNETTNLVDKHTTLVKEMSLQVIDWSRSLPHRNQPYNPQ